MRHDAFFRRVLLRAAAILIVIMYALTALVQFIGGVRPSTEIVYVSFDEMRTISDLSEKRRKTSAFRQGI